jgi:hypothetical protein
MSSASALQQLVAKFSRQMASSAAGSIGRKVVVLGAAGGIGQPLSMLMKVVASVHYGQRGPTRSCVTYHHLADPRTAPALVSFNR